MLLLCMYSCSWMVVVSGMSLLYSWLAKYSYPEILGELARQGKLPTLGNEDFLE